MNANDLNVIAEAHAAAMTALQSAPRWPLTLDPTDADRRVMEEIDALRDDVAADMDLAQAEEDQREAEHLAAIADWADAAETELAALHAPAELAHLNAEAAIDNAHTWLLENVTGQEWDRLVGQQGRREFAEITIRAGANSPKSPSRTAKTSKTAGPVTSSTSRARRDPPQDHQDRGRSGETLHRDRRKVGTAMKTRGLTHKPQACIYAALEARGLLTRNEASRYRTGKRRPSTVTLRAWALLGYVPGVSWPEREG